VTGGFAVTAIGRDQPGIVAAISGVFADLEANIEDARMAILRGNFAVMLIAALPEGADQAELETRLAEVKDRLGLEAVAVNRVEKVERPPHPTHTLTVYGADHPGIVHAISAALAERVVNITDLEARLTVSGKRPVYAMTMELELPSRISSDELRAALVAVGSDAGVEVSLREIGNAAPRSARR
jgi:glycine cleavage system transcriptional repressor